MLRILPLEAAKLSVKVPEEEIINISKKGVRYFSAVDVFDLVLLMLITIIIDLRQPQKLFA